MFNASLAALRGVVEGLGRRNASLAALRGVVEGLHDIVLSDGEVGLER